MRKINTTLEIAETNILDFEQELRSLSDIEVIDFRILPETNELYENDETFRKLVKLEKKARNTKLDYLNKHR